MLKRKIFLIIVFVVFLILLYSTYIFHFGKISNMGEKVFKVNEIYVVLTTGFKNDNVQVNYNDSIIFKGDITTNISCGMASDFISFKLKNNEDLGILCIKINHVLKFRHKINPKYKACLIKKGLFYIEAELTNNKLQFD